MDDKTRVPCWIPAWSVSFPSRVEYCAEGTRSAIPHSQGVSAISKDYGEEEAARKEADARMCWHDDWDVNQLSSETSMRLYCMRLVSYITQSM